MPVNIPNTYTICPKPYTLCPLIPRTPNHPPLLPPHPHIHRLHTLLEIASQYSSVSPDGAYTPQSMITAVEDLPPVTAIATGRGHGRALLGGVHPEGDLPSNILVMENNHGGGSGALPNLVSKRRLAEAGRKGGKGVLSEVGSPLVCGDGICSGERGGRTSPPKCGLGCYTDYFAESLALCGVRHAYCACCSPRDAAPPPDVLSPPHADDEDIQVCSRDPSGKCGDRKCQAWLGECGGEKCEVENVGLGSARHGSVNVPPDPLTLCTFLDLSPLHLACPARPPLLPTQTRTARPAPMTAEAI